MRGRGGAIDRPALALTLLVHLLLVLAFVRSRDQQGAQETGSRERFLLVPLLPAPPAKPRATGRRPPPPAAPVRRAPRDTGLPPSAAALPTVQALPRTDPAPALPPAPAAPANDAAPAAMSAADILARARKQAGAIDHELRAGKPGVPRTADTPGARLRQGLESAYIDRSHTEVMDTYTSADGVVIYRFRQGNKVRCRTTGSVGLGIPGGYSQGAVLAGAGSMGGGGTAGTVACPNDDRGWVRQ